jgi:hypothetical protein
MIAYKALSKSRPAFYAPNVSEPARQTRDDLGTFMTRVEGYIELEHDQKRVFPNRKGPKMI